MLVDMYRISSPEASNDGGILDALKKVQLNFRDSAGCLGQRLLRDLEHPEDLIAVSYWLDRESLASAREMHAAIDRALSGLKAKTVANAYELIQELL